MADGMVTKTNEYLNQFIGDAMGQLKELQPTKPGTVPRSKRERNAIWERLIKLEKPELRDTMNLMAERAGHKDGETVPCELCRFLAERIPD